MIHRLAEGLGVPPARLLEHGEQNPFHEGQ
jgi:hypothetical protein